MAASVKRNVGKLADVTSADAGYFAEAALEQVAAMGTELLVPPDRQRHGANTRSPAAERMRRKLQGAPSCALYKMRKAIVEPVFGQLKAGRALRRFCVRGLQNVRAEFLLMALTHNVLKLFRFAPSLAATASLPKTRP